MEFKIKDKLRIVHRKSWVLPLNYLQPGFIHQATGHLWKLLTMRDIQNSSVPERLTEHQCGEWSRTRTSGFNVAWRSGHCYCSSSTPSPPLLVSEVLFSTGNTFHMARMWKVHHSTTFTGLGKVSPISGRKFSSRRVTTIKESSLVLFCRNYQESLWSGTAKETFVTEGATADTLHNTVRRWWTSLVQALRRGNF